MGDGLVKDVQPAFHRLAEVIDRFFPLDSPRRKVLHLVSVILLVEGVFVLVLFSYVGITLGLTSLALGAVLMVLLFRAEQQAKTESEAPPGVRLVTFIEEAIGGGYAVMASGATLLVLVVLYNTFVSEWPEYGDIDTMCMMLGVLLLVFPLIPKGWKYEAVFALLFLAFVVLLLAVPQAVMSIGSGGEPSTLGNWYVHYMLAAPFAMALDTIGVPAVSFGNLVTIQFQDGSVHTLTISAYCAGLYSFSIFLSAFFSYVLVFEKLRNRLLFCVLGLGLLIAYLGNLLRMVVVGIIGYYHGIEALHWAHENAGWLIFISWSALFWWMILGWLGSRGRIERTRNTTPAPNEDDQTP